MRTPARPRRLQPCSSDAPAMLDGRVARAGAPCGFAGSRGIVRSRIMRNVYRIHMRGQVIWLEVRRLPPIMGFAICVSDSLLRKNTVPYKGACSTQRHGGSAPGLVTLLA